MTTPVIDRDLTETLNLDTAPKCGWVDPECDRSATHRALTIPCGCMMLMCSEHTAAMRWILQQTGHWYCEFCGAQFGHATGADLMRIEPL